MPYVRGHYRRSSRASSAGASGCGFLLVVALGIIGAIVGAVAAAAKQAGTWARENLLVVLFTAGAAVGAVAWLAIRDRRRKRLRRERVEQYWNAAVRLIQDKHASMVRAAKVLDARRLVQTVPPQFVTEFEKLYRQTVAEVVADRKVDESERKRLDAIKRGLSIPSDVAQRAEIEGYLQAHAALVGDGRLTQEEEGLLTDLRESLRVPAETVKAQLARAAELRKAREVSQAPLRAVGCDVKLKKGEACYHAVAFVEKKKRVTRTYQEDGVRYSDTDLEPYRSGTLYVTNQRVLLVAEGTTNIKLASVLDNAVDPDEGVVALTVDGRKTPYYLAVGEPFVTSAYIDRAASAAPG